LYPGFFTLTQYPGSKDRVRMAVWNVSGINEQQKKFKVDKIFQKERFDWLSV